MSQTDSTIQQLALIGSTRAEIESTIGHAFTQAETDIFNKARTMRRLKRAREAQEAARKKRAEADARARENIAKHLAGTSWPDADSLFKRPLTSTERSRNFRALGRELPPFPPPRHRRVRKACSVSLLRFGLTYFLNDAYDGMKPLLKRPPSPHMIKFIMAVEYTIKHGGNKHVRWPRGKGKTSWMKIAAIWATTNGYKSFFVVVEKVKTMGREVVEEIWLRIRVNRRFAADYPEFAIPMNDVAYTPQRMRSQTYQGRPTRMKMDAIAGYYKLPTIVNMPHTGAIICWRGAEQALRGINIESARPDFFFIDDPQTDEDARNPETVARIEDNIQGGILGSGELSERISAVMASTPIEPDDVSERFADPKRHPEWMAETERLVRKWGNEDLRDEYLALLAADTARGDQTLAASHAYYVAHRAEIEAGAEMMDDGDFNPEVEVSAYQHALWLLHHMKHKRFYSEMQMEPHRDEAIVIITPRLILSRIRHGSAAAQIPDGTVLVILSTDINPSYAITNTALAFDAMRTGLVIDHWRHPCNISINMNDTEFYQAIFDVLGEVHLSLADRGLVASARDFHWGIDASGMQSKPVNRFAAELRRQKLNAYAMRGLDNKWFNPRIATRKFAGVPGKNDTVLVLDKTTGYEHINYNKDKYELTAHRAWLSAVGSPGGLSLYETRGGVIDTHEEFALQVCGEQLKWKPADPDRDRVGFKWDPRAYPRHDYGDTVYQGIALAGFLGLTAEGAPIRAANPPRRRRAIVGGHVY